MSKISVLTGEVIDGKPQEYMTLKDENFMSIKVQFLDALIDVVVSEYVVQESYDGKVNVTGYLASRVVKGGKPEFYFFANTITEADADAPLTNKVTFNYKVTKVSEFKANARGIDILPLVVADYTANHTTSVLFLCVRGKSARKLKGKEKGYYITGEGYLKQYRDIYEIITTDVTVDGIE